MANEPFPLLKRLKAGSYENCVIVTYNADLYFFEQVVLPTLRSGGCNNNLVVMDLQQYEASLLSGGNRLVCLGKSYSVWPVSVRGAFHPKLILQSGQRSGRLILGSGNLTVRGFSSNWELFTEIQRGGEAGNDRLFHEVWSFIVSVAEAAVGAAERQLRQVEETSKWLLETSKPLSWPRVLVGAPGRPSIATQLREIIGQRKVRRLVVIAPFFDSNLRAVRELADIFNPGQFWLVVQPDTVSLPGTVATKMKQLRMVKFKAPQKEKSAKAYLHAKAYIIETENGDYCLWGSPNCSSAAIANPTNVELAILQVGKRGEFVRKLNLSSLLKKDHCIDPSSLTVSETESDSREVQFRLVGAEVVKHTVHVLLADKGFKSHVMAGRLVFYAGAKVIGQVDAERETDVVFSAQFALPQDKGTILCRLVLNDEGTDLISAPAAVHFASEIARATPSRHSGDIDRISRAIQSGATDWAKGLEQVCELLFKIETSVPTDDLRTTKAGVARKKSALHDEGSKELEEIKEYEHFVGSGKSPVHKGKSDASVLLEDILGALTSQMQRGRGEDSNDAAADENDLRRYQEEAESGSAESGGTVAFDLVMDSDDAFRAHRRLKNSYRRLMRELCKRYESLRDSETQATADELWRLGAVNLLLMNGCERELGSAPSAGAVLTSADVLSDYLPAIGIILGRVRVLANRESGPLAMKAELDSADQHVRRAAATTSLILSALLEARRRWLQQPEFIRGKEARNNPSYFLEITAARSFATLIRLGILPSTENFVTIAEDAAQGFGWLARVGALTLQTSFRELTRRGNVIVKAEDSYNEKESLTPTNTIKEGSWVCAPSTGVTEVLKVRGKNVELARIGGRKKDEERIKVTSRVVILTGLSRSL